MTNSYGLIDNHSFDRCLLALLAALLQKQLISHQLHESKK